MEATGMKQWPEDRRERSDAACFSNLTISYAPLFAIALEFDFLSAGENIRAFQISGKSGDRSKCFQNRVANLQVAESAIRILQSILMPIDFKGRFAVESIVRWEQKNSVR
jgi:hypothetical protein